MLINETDAVQARNSVVSETVRKANALEVGHTQPMVVADET